MKEMASLSDERPIPEKGGSPQKLLFFNARAEELYRVSNLEDDVQMSDHERLRITSKYNSVLHLVQSEFELSCRIADDSLLNSPRAMEILKHSWKITVGKDVENLNFRVDKVLRHKTADDLKSVYEERYSSDDESVFSFPSPDGSINLLVFTPAIRRVVRSVAAVQLLGGSKRLAEVVREVGKHLDWTHSQLELCDRFDIISEDFSVRELSFPEPPIPDFSSSMARSGHRQPRTAPAEWKSAFSRSRITWNDLVVYPHSFILMLSRALAMRTSLIIPLCYLSLSASSELLGDRISRSGYKFPIQLRTADPALSLFGCWTVACVCADWLASSRSQWWITSWTQGKSLSTEISLKARQLRNLNHKIAKHVFGCRLSRAWGDAITAKQGKALFDELSKKWKGLFRDPTTVAFKALEAYVAQFRDPENFAFRASRVQDLLDSFPRPDKGSIGKSWRLQNGLLLGDERKIFRRGHGSFLSYYKKVSENCEVLMSNNLIIVAQENVQGWYGRDRSLERMSGMSTMRIVRVQVPTILGGMLDSSFGDDRIDGIVNT